MVLQSLFIGYCSSDFIYRNVKDMTELEKQEREIEHSCINGAFLDELEPDRGNINTEIMEDCTIACQLLTWGR